MNARVTLLVLVTGLFMATWNSDRCAMEAAIVRRGESRCVIASGRAITSQSVLAVPDATCGSHRGGDSAVLESARFVVSERHVRIPLPAGIPAGLYQAVSQAGETHRVIVSATALPESCPKATPFVSSGVYLTDESSPCRWYLIPITPDTSAAQTSL